jgi:hypothetical protein
MRALSFAYAGTALLAAAVGLGLWTQQSQADSPKSPKVPKYEVDSTWPKPFPSTPDPVTGRARTWIPGEVAGTCVDSRDHVFIVTRGNLIAPEGVKGIAAPPIMEFDTEGNTVAAWGDRNVLPNGIHGCFVDYQDNIWIAGNGDGIVQKYSRSGSLMLQIGTRGVCDNPPANTCGNSGTNPAANQSQTLLNQPADMWVDPNPDPMTGQRGSVYIADGYGNHRVVVFSATGQYLRQWGGVAGTVINVTSDYPDKFGAGDGGHPHCVVGGNDGLMYVCDRQNDRVQVFTSVPRRRTPARYRGFCVGSRLFQRLGADVHVRGRRRQRADADHESYAGHHPVQIRPARTSSHAVHIPPFGRQGLEGQPVYGRDDQRSAHPEVQTDRVQQRER